MEGRGRGGVGLRSRCGGGARRRSRSEVPGDAPSDHVVQILFVPLPRSGGQGRDGRGVDDGGTGQRTRALAGLGLRRRPLWLLRRLPLRRVGRIVARVALVRVSPLAAGRPPTLPRVLLPVPSRRCRNRRWLARRLEHLTLGQRLHRIRVHLSGARHGRCRPRRGGHRCESPAYGAPLLLFQHLLQLTLLPLGGECRDGRCVDHCRTVQSRVGRRGRRQRPRRRSRRSSGLGAHRRRDIRSAAGFVPEHPPQLSVPVHIPSVERTEGIVRGACRRQRFHIAGRGGRYGGRHVRRGGRGRRNGRLGVEVEVTREGLLGPRGRRGRRRVRYRGDVQ
mmetsp:Transcript_3868/g.10599  ORF Transcript_3868/g.10599 Transcript_3868/m.10599 type:complete len:334 (-) Transcript_3868:765-1766(-)